MKITKLPPKTTHENTIAPGQQIKRVGRYLYKNIDGAFESRNSPNMYEIWFTLLYEIPKINDERYKRSDDTLYELTIYINITTYKNKIRVNTCTEEEDRRRTLGFDLFESRDLQDLKVARDEIYNCVCNRVQRAYKGYDIVF